MTKTDPQYHKSRDSPLISTTHPSRYLSDYYVSKPIDYSIIHSGIPDQRHNKNTVVMSNLTRKYQDDGTRRLQPNVEKSREKNLNLTGDQTGTHSRFMQKETPKHNTYYILSDKEDDISDTYYFHNNQSMHHKFETPYDVVVKSDNLGIFPTCKKVPLSHELDNKNTRLIRSKKDLKDV